MPAAMMTVVTNARWKSPSAKTKRNAESESREEGWKKGPSRKLW
jgi:hypothetical protein